MQWIWQSTTSDDWLLARFAIVPINSNFHYCIIFGINFAGINRCVSFWTFRILAAVLNFPTHSLPWAYRRDVHINYRLALSEYTLQNPPFFDSIPRPICDNILAANLMGQIVAMGIKQIQNNLRTEGDKNENGHLCGQAQ